ncbi:MULTISPECIES: hypothetical protein [Streptomyces violaceusniger group]|uniref:hypothetical protein n=1 Tax=Streptomyces violaceusniger group TaxID=2839105 RepID=UPI001BA5A957|nr:MULTISPECIES: hypothetical protein [Streptomyces violaceusniger group]
MSTSGHDVDPSASPVAAGLVKPRLGGLDAGRVKLRIEAEESGLGQAYEQHRMRPAPVQGGHVAPR